MNSNDALNAAQAVGVDPNLYRSQAIIGSKISAVQSQAPTPAPKPNLNAVRIINCKNGYLIMPDNVFGERPDFEASYVAKDLDEVKEALARHYVAEKLA